MKVNLTKRTLTFQHSADAKRILGAVLRRAEFNRHGGLSDALNLAIVKAFGPDYEDARRKYTARKLRECSKS